MANVARYPEMRLGNRSQNGTLWNGTEGTQNCKTCKREQDSAVIGIWQWLDVVGDPGLKQKFESTYERLVLLLIWGRTLPVALVALVHFWLSVLLIRWQCLAKPTAEFSATNGWGASGALPFVARSQKEVLWLRVPWGRTATDAAVVRVSSGEQHKSKLQFSLTLPHSNHFYDMWHPVMWVHMDASVRWLKELQALNWIATVARFC